MVILLNKSPKSMSPASDPPVGLGGISSEARQAINETNHKMRKSTPETKT